MKIAVSMVLLFGFLASAPAIAKQAHVLHTGTPPAGGAKATNAKPAETIDADATVMTPRGGFTPVDRNANASQRFARPENFTRRPGVSAPIALVVRTAIGQPVQPRSVMVEAPHVTPLVQAPRVVPKAITPNLFPARPASPSNVGRTTFRAVGTAGVPDAGRIDGTHLIRPSAAPIGIGGPSHAAGGINGTTVRIKR